MRQAKPDRNESLKKPINSRIILIDLADWLKNISEYFPKSFGTIKRWIGEIIAYFDEGTTQGVVEGINNKLKLIKRRAFGFRNFDNFERRQAF